MSKQEETASSQTPAPQQGQASDLPENTIQVEEIGPCRVKIKVEIPQGRIEGRLEKELDELRRTAAVPGFRIGHAPVQLIEKRFGSDTRQRLKDLLVAEALQEAVEKKELKTLGEPDLNLEAIEMPKDGPMVFEVQTDIQPAFELPVLEGIALNKQLAEIDEEQVDAAVKNMLAREGVYEPVKGAAKEQDQVVGDLWLKVGEKEITRRADMALLAGETPMKLMSVELNELCKKFVGAKADSTVTAEATVGEDHPDEQSRGKQATVGMDIKDVKRLKIPPLTGEWLKKAGWESEDEFRSMVKANLERQAEQRTVEDLRTQMRDYLLSRTSLQLPEKVSDEQISLAETRQLVRLMRLGVAEEQARKMVSENAEKTRTRALEETKLFFVLGRIAEQYEIRTEEAEVNGQIASMAGMYGIRPEKLKQTLAKSGRLETMIAEIREQKVLDKLISQAKVTEVKPEKKVAKKASPKPAKKADKAAEPAKPKAKAKAKKKTSS